MVIQSRIRCRSRGFTLVEIVATLTVSGLLLGGFVLFLATVSRAVGESTITGPDNEAYFEVPSRAASSELANIVRLAIEAHRDAALTYVTGGANESILANVLDPNTDPARGLPFNPTSLSPGVTTLTVDLPNAFDLEAFTAAHSNFREDSAETADFSIVYLDYAGVVQGATHQRRETVNGIAYYTITYEDANRTDVVRFAIPVARDILGAQYGASNVWVQSNPDANADANAALGGNEALGARVVFADPSLAGGEGATDARFTYFFTIE